MTAPSFIEMTPGDPADIPALPATGNMRILVDVATGEFAQEDDTGTVTPLGTVGPTGPAGPGVPATVTAHGSMGATETFDYDGGNGSAHSGTVNAALTISLTGWAASGNESIMSLYLTTDGTGGYGTPTWPAAVVNDADYTTWDDAAGAFNVIRLWSIDGGTTVYIAIDEAGGSSDLDAIITASAGQDIADALAGAAAPDAGNVFATIADVTGSGGVTASENFLTSPVTMTTSGTYYDGPSLSLAAGTYALFGRAVVSVPSIANVNVRLWDGTTVLDNPEELMSTGGQIALPVFGYVVLGSTTTIKISATAGANGSTFVETGGQYGTTNKASHLVALKLA